MAITVEIVLQDASLELQWQTLSISESIGQPDTLSVSMAEVTASLRALLLPANIYPCIVVRKNADILFSGLATRIRRRNQKGALTYTLQAVGWEFLAAKRLVGTPYTWGIPPEIEWGDVLPTPFWTDSRAIGSPTPGSIEALWTAYWIFPSIDLTTYLTDILPVGIVAEQITWSGSDLAGATDDLCALGSAAAAWWTANDSPDAQSTIAPNLALHVGLIVLPEGDDELLAGFPSADEPTNVAPYAISDTPDWTTSIMASTAPELDVAHDQRVDGVFVRGATGNTLDIIPSGSAPFFQVGLEHQSGTGWIGAGGGGWGEAYVDAPAAITETQRIAFGSSYLAVHGFPVVTGTIPVDGYDGWHKGQAVQVTDAGLGLDARWLLIRSVSVKVNDPMGEALSYVLTVGDALTAQIGYALRRQRLEEQRKPVDPGTQFVPYMGDLSPDPGGTLPVRMQFATDSGQVRRVKGVNAEWSLLINGDWAVDPFDTGELFWLSAETTVTNDTGQITAVLNASASATAADAALVKAEVLL